MQRSKELLMPASMWRTAMRVPLVSSNRCAPLCTPTRGVAVKATGGELVAGRSFKAPPNVGPGRNGSQLLQEANPYKSWEHMNHKWLILMCVGCLAGGIAAGQLAEVDESKLRPPFSKERVLADVAKTFEFRPDLAATGIRVAFILAARRAGFAPESVDESCAVVRGLEDIAGVMQQLATVHGLSTEDSASLVAIAAVKFLKGPCDAVESAWRWGRNDTDEAPQQRRKQPTTTTTTTSTSGSGFAVSEMLEGLGGLSDAECVALMSCHSVGEFHEHVSGIDGVTHIGSRYKLGNEYYRFLLANEAHFFGLEVPRTEENKEIQHLPKDFVCVYAKVGKKGRKRQCVFNKREVDAILGNPTWRKLAAQFATDEAAWAEAFQSAFTKMIDSNFKRLRPYSASVE